jgi:hypothetical protein
VCALGDFLVLSASVLRQIARYLPHHTSGNASKTHPKSSHDKFKTVSDISRILLSTVSVFQRACCDGRGCRDDVHIVSTLVALEILGTMEIAFIGINYYHRMNMVGHDYKQWNLCMWIMRGNVCQIFLCSFSHIR